MDILKKRGNVTIIEKGGFFQVRKITLNQQCWQLFVAVLIAAQSLLPARNTQEYEGDDCVGNVKMQAARTGRRRCGRRGWQKSLH